ncbi:MAG: PAS domain-containing protein [Chloroflexota bacterium]
MNKNIFSPAVALMARLKFPQRFALITVLFLLPLGMALFMLVSKMNHDIDVAQREVQGANYLRPVNALLGHTLNDWLLSQQAMRGLDVNNDALAENKAKIDKDFQDLAAADAQYGKALGTTEKMTKLKLDWDAMSALPQTIDRQILYRPFIASVRDLIAYTGDQSSLILDPQLDTYYMMDSVVVDLPDIQNSIAELGVLADTVVGSRNILDEERAELTVISRQVTEGFAAMQRKAGVAFANNPVGNLKTSVEGPLANAEAASKTLTSMFETEISTAPQIMLSLDTWMATVTEALDSSATLWDAQASQLTYLLQTRSATDARGRNVALLITATTLLLVVYMWVGFYLAVMRTVTGLEDASRMLASGNIDGALDLGNQDELSKRTAAAFTTMASATNSLNSAMNARTNELTEVALLLAHMHDGVVITDPQGVVKVLNGAASRMLGVKYEDVVNNSLVELTRQPRLQETMASALANPTQHYMVDIALNNRVISSTVTFAPLSDGTVSGLVMLQDVTELRTLQMLQQQQQTNRLAAVAR